MSLLARIDLVHYPLAANTGRKAGTAIQYLPYILLIYSISFIMFSNREVCASDSIVTNSEFAPLNTASTAQPSLVFFPTPLGNTGPHPPQLAPGASVRRPDSPTRQKRGRPRTIKEEVLVPKRPRGRPRKNPPPLPSAKRRPGRPRKEQNSGGVVIDFGTFVVSGTRKVQSAQIAVPKLIGGSGSIFAPVSTTPTGGAGPSRAKPLANIGQDALAQPLHNAAPNNCLPEVEVDDDDDEGDGAGIGEEDGDDDDDDDEKDDERDEGECASGSGTPGRSRRRPLPSWLKTAFTRVLNECDSRDSQGRSPLYSRHTFWCEPPSPYFCLEGDSTSPISLYRPRFFVWDPMILYKQLPCPTCGHVLNRHCAISRPRRVVDMDSPFWLIGYRYHCRHCLNHKTQKRSVTWRSWDRRILACLPAQLASEFPAHLSHRSGMSKPLFAWMRSCFQSGMGAKQFSDALRVQHLLRYDELHLQYLEWLVSRVVMDSWIGRKYKSFLKFNDASDEGYQGFVPSSQWFRDMYDNFIEEHRTEFNQHMGMLTAEICAIDHSHKITKHVAKVNGERVFNGLLTITNEFGEIRSCNLVATKAQTQFELALTRMRESLDLYGHKQPELFYTDNMSDKSFLESSFPSLRRDITPVEKYGHLEPFVLPPDVQILVRSEVSSINAALSTIIAKVPVDEDEADLIIGYDSEWNVVISDDGRHERGEIAVVQIAFEKRVYILQISEMVAHRRLPEKLTMLLQNSRIWKVGRMVSSDLRQLQETVGCSTSFCGALDLASYAKERHAIKNARCSLSNLCAVTLHRQLSKNVSERTSAAWEHANLTTEQLHYAACDAYVPLLIYQQLSTLSVPKHLPTDPLSSTPVLVYATDNTTIVATGSLSTLIPVTTFKDIRVTRLHTVVTINTVLVPGAILTSHRKQPLLSFGDVPFDAVCLRSHLRSYDPVKFRFPATTELESNDRGTEGAPRSSVTEIVATVEPRESSDDVLDVDDGVGNLLHIWDVEDTSASNSETGGVKSTERDEESESYGRKILSTLSNPESWSTVLRSRVLKDVFHVFNMLRISTTHGLRKEFGRALRDAIFIPDKEDRLRIAAWAATLKPPKTFEQLAASIPKWLWRHCRRIIPPPEILFPLIQRLFAAYGALKDASTHAPLFSKDNWKICKSILELIRQGFISDPPGISLFTIIGLNPKAGNLPIYRCSRGTNFTEGGVHTHLLARLPTTGTSVRHLNACLPDFILGHNLRVGTKNRTGKAYQGHYAIWLVNLIQEHLSFLRDVLIQPLELNGWVNGNLYLPTSERLGILPVPLDVCIASGMAEYNPSTASKKQRHLYLARMQGTRKAVLPVHTPAEHDLFNELMISNSSFNSQSSGPSWKLAVKVWNSHADEKAEIFYKLTEHLKAYYAQWQTNLNVRQSLSLTTSVRASVVKDARDPSRADAAPQISNRPLTLHSVTCGYDIEGHNITDTSNGNRRLAPTSSTPPQISTSTRPITLKPPTTTSTPGPSTIPAHDSPTSTQTTGSSMAALLASKRVSAGIQKSRPKDKAEPTKKKPRVCRRCARDGCPGRGAVKHCRNRCRDCGEFCKGRNPHRPGRRCDDPRAWDD